MTDDLVKAALDEWRAAKTAQQFDAALAKLVPAMAERIEALEAENAALIQDRNRWAEEAKAETSPIVFALEAEVARLKALLDNPGKEVMPDDFDTGRNSNSHDTAPASLSAGGGAGWQPIETIPAQGCVVVGCWVGSRWSWWEGLASDLGCDGEYGDEPTHWMPLPAPPMKGPTDADV